MKLNKLAFTMVVAAVSMVGASAFAAAPDAPLYSENGEHQAVVIQNVPQHTSVGGSGVFTITENGDYQAAPAE